VNSDVRVEVERVEGSDGSSSSADLVGGGGS
jgi:hypothetical protein